MQTLEEAKQFLRANWEKGAVCPCCKQLVKRYRRPMHHSMIRMLVNLYRLTYLKGEDFYHLTEIIGDLKLTGTTDFAILSYWKFIEKKVPNENENTKSSGMWRITRRGKDFVENKIAVQSHALIYNAKCLGFDGEHIQIGTAFSKFFDYNELIQDIVIPDDGQTKLL